MNTRMVLLNMNLNIGVIIAGETWKNLRNNREKTYHWGKKDYKLWFFLIILSTFVVTAQMLGLTRFVIISFEREYLLLSSIYFLVIIYCLTQIHTKLNNLSQSVTYKFNILDLKKLKSYIFAF